MLFRFSLQNTNRKDYVKFSKEFFQHLLNRGHNHNILHKLFLQSADKLDKKLQTQQNLNPFYLKTISDTQNQTQKNNADIFFHTKYHPNNIPPSLIQNTFQHTLSQLSFVNKLIICNHRPENIRDKLIPSNILPQN